MMNVNANPYAFCLTLGLATACSGGNRLEETVARRCSEAEMELKEAVADPAVPAYDLRRIESGYLRERFSFCLEVRELGERRFQSVRNDFSELSQRLRESDASAERGKALVELATLLSWVNSFPLID